MLTVVLVDVAVPKVPSTAQVLLAEVGRNTYMVAERPAVPGPLTDGFALQLPLYLHQNMRDDTLLPLFAVSLVQLCPPALLIDNAPLLDLY